MVWAAITIVLAVVKRHRSVAGHCIPSSVDCISRAELMLSGDIKVLCNQVDMNMLLQASWDRHLPFFLIASTMRPPYGISLHSQPY
ncbi:unnamed protein product [Periconia digitata]|uniref:Secreted protein n=1 Tax=Periconia digitata TaxID=1303443 RepID=A0A9W4XLQ7_9PLEO|nr:unnamed protein product [Periconia digitata]